MRGDKPYKEREMKRLIMPPEVLNQLRLEVQMKYVMSGGGGERAFTQVCEQFYNLLRGQYPTE